MTASMPLAAGRAAPATGFARQCLHTVLQAAANPGSIVRVHPDGLPAGRVSAAAWVACAGLPAADRGLWLGSDMRRDTALLGWLRFQCGASCGVPSQSASFALLHAREWDGRRRFRHAEPAAPHDSTTVIIEVEGLQEEDGVTLYCDDHGEPRTLRVRGLDERFWVDLNHNYRHAPYGLDFLLTWRDRLVVISRHCFTGYPRA